MIRLLSLTEDILVYIVSFLRPPDILSLAKTCKTLCDLTRLRIVWTNARTYHVIGKGYPTLNIPSERLSTSDLIKHTRHAFGLGERWLRGISAPRKVYSISGTSGISVSDVCFVPGFNQRLLLTISKSIWSAVSIWNISLEAPQKLAEWSPRGAIFDGFALNSEMESEATIAISLRIDECKPIVKILSLREAEGHYVFHEIHSVDAGMKPITLSGDLLALSDSITQTAIWNWRLGTYALLDSARLNIDENEDPLRTYQYDFCIQIIFAHQSILVVRAHTIHLFPYPILRAPASSRTAETETDQPSSPSLASHSFGWVDSVSVTQCPHLQVAWSHPWPSLALFVRGECDNPWDSDPHNMCLYILDPNLDYTAFPSSASTASSATSTSAPLPTQHLPYIFPPRLAYKIPSPHGSLRCKQVILGRLGTAMWIRPRDRNTLGLMADIFVDGGRKRSHEDVMMGVFPGSLTAKAEVWWDNGGESENEEEGEEVVGVVEGERVWQNENNDCASLDYDEELGRVVLGTSFGKIWIFEV